MAKKWTAIIISAIIFGVFHTSLIRLIPTAILGGVFAYLVYSTGSLFSSMICRFIIDSSSCISSRVLFLNKGFPFLVVTYCFFDLDSFSLSNTAAFMLFFAYSKGTVSSLYFSNVASNPYVATDSFISSFFASILSSNCISFIYAFIILGVSFPNISQKFI